MQKYNSYKPSNVEWLGEVPSHWKVEKVKRRMNFEYGSALKEEDRIEGNFSVYGSNGIVGTHELCIAKNPTIIIGRKGTAGALNYSNEPCYPIDTAYFIDNSSTIENIRFLFYALQTLDLDQMNEDSAVPGLSREVAYQKKLAFPPRSEQKEIASYLDHTTAYIDKATSTKRQQIERLEQYKKSKIHECVTKGLDQGVKLKDSGFAWIGEVPIHWKIERLKIVVDKIGSGVTPKGGSAVYLDTGIPLIRSQNVHNDGLDFSDIACITQEIHDDMSGSKVTKGDVLLNITGASIGRCYYYDSNDEANVNQHVCILRHNHLMTTNYLYYLMISEVGQSQIFSGFKGSGREGLGNEAIKVFKIPLPKTNEQRKIAEYLDFFCKNISKEKEIIEEQITCLQQYRKSLIHECVTGKRKVIND